MLYLLTLHQGQYVPLDWMLLKQSLHISCIDCGHLMTMLTYL